VLAGCSGGSTASSEAAPTPASSEAAGESSQADSEDGYHLGICIHSLDNEYWAQEAAGAELFAKSVGNCKYDVLTCNSDDNKQLQGIKDYIARYGDKAIFVVDPSSTANTANIADVCEQSGNYVVILAHRADGLYPKDYPHFVASLMLSDFNNGYKTACELFDSIGGKGEICELQGQLGDDSAANRHKGFEAALKEYPDIKCVDTQVANWEQAKAMSLTEEWLVSHPDVKAIYSANDTMALGAIEALKNKNQNGTIKVCGCDGTKAALDAIQSGDMLCTIANDGFCIAGYGAAYAYQAATGKLDISSMDAAKRLIYCKTMYVDSSNVSDVINKFITKGDPGYDYTDLSYCIDSYQED
jgi:ribose transport system substrate-binding protein